MKEISYITNNNIEKYEKSKEDFRNFNEGDAPFNLSIYKISNTQTSYHENHWINYKQNHLS